jgi:hypothetical protein
MWLKHFFSLSIWYPRHYLQFRIGLFFGAASLAGKFYSFILAKTVLIITPYRRIFRSPSLRHQLHAWQTRATRMVVDFRMFQHREVITSALIPLSDHRRNCNSRGWFASTIRYVPDSIQLDVKYSTLTSLFQLLVLVDFPDTAAFLTQEERAYVIWRKSALHSLFFAHCRKG